MIKKSLAMLLIVAMPSLGMAGKEEVEFQGGTISIKTGAKLRVNLTDPGAAVFDGAGSLRVPWTGIKSIEYGQTASRRVTSAILLSPLALFSKSRKHFVSIEWVDEQGSPQSAALRADKNNFRAILSALRTKSGIEVSCGDPEAAKYFNCSNSTELLDATKKK